MTEDEIRGWQISINADPVNIYISRLEPVAYKFVERYRELIMLYKNGEKTEKE